MPELPDVEGFRRKFARHAEGKLLKRVEAPAADMIRNTTAADLNRTVRGRHFAKSRRHGKWLIAPTQGGSSPVVLLHFGMTGGFAWGKDEGGRHRHDRVVFVFTDGELRYRNMRKLGGVWLVRDENAVESVTGPLGPDAMDVDREEFEEMLTSRRGGLKAALMRQQMIAGIGNELSDEILWQARLSPRRQLATLTKRNRSNLHRSMREVITISNRHGLIPRREGWITSQRRSRDPRCPRCNRPVRRETVAGRTAYWCPRCQR